MSKRHIDYLIGRIALPTKVEYLSCAHILLDRHRSHVVTPIDLANDFSNWVRRQLNFRHLVALAQRVAIEPGWLYSVLKHQLDGCHDSFLKPFCPNRCQLLWLSEVHPDKVFLLCPPKVERIIAKQLAKVLQIDELYVTRRLGSAISGHHLAYLRGSVGSVIGHDLAWRAEAAAGIAFLGSDFIEKAVVADAAEDGDSEGAAAFGRGSTI